MAYIKALSYYLPKSILSNEELIKQFPEWSAEKVTSKIGVRSRHISDNNETAGDMAEKAARKLFKEYNIDPQSIDFILFCTQSPDYFLPSTACILQDRLGIPTHAAALDYNLGCSGCVYGIAMANSFVESGLANNVLLLTGETYHKYIHPKDKSNLSIFGDGAAACLISKNGFARIGETVLGTDGNGAENLIVRTGASKCKNKTGIVSIDEDGHEKHDDYLYMNGSEIFNFTLNVVPTLTTQVLEKNNLKKDDIDMFVFHQANKFMLDTIRKICAFPKEKFYINIEETGNTVSSTVLIALKQNIDNGHIHAGMNVVIAGFGVGLSWGATVLKFN